MRLRRIRRRRLVAPRLARSKYRHRETLGDSSGKESIQRILRSPVQAKLSIGQANDKYEQEADRVADKVMSMPDASLQRVEGKDEEEQVQSKPLADQITPLVQRQADAPEDDQEEPVQAKLMQRQAAEEEETAQAMPIQRQAEEEEEPVQAKERSATASKVSSGLESRINSSKSGGQPLDPATRSFFEPRFGRCFGDVRIHNDGQAADVSRKINARAFTLGNHVAFGSGEYQPQSNEGKRLLGHELTHVVQQGEISGLKSQTKIQCDLARRPPGRTQQSPQQFDADGLAAAIAYNNRRFGPNVTRQILDIVGAAPTGRFDADSIHMIGEWQADFRLTQDGKIGLRTMREIVKEMIAEGMRNTAIWTIIDGHNMRTAGLINIRYDRTVAANATTTAQAIPGPSRIRVGPAGFSQGYEGLVHTVAHEFEHVRQFRAGIRSINVMEFLGESIELRSSRMLRENVAGFMDDARRALSFWNLMTLAERRTNRQTFFDIQGSVVSRFNGASAQAQATHRGTFNAYRAVNVP